MQVQDRVIVITGAASGIGRALALRFAAEGAAGIVIADLNEAGAIEVAEMIGDRALPVRADVSVERNLHTLVDTAERAFGPVDLFCSNAGNITGKGLEATEADWARSLGVNLMGHVYAARAVVPRMVERGEGYLLQTCSAAGLLSCPGDAPYAVSKTAAIAFAEWLAIHYAARGIRVSVLAPQGVQTGMTPLNGSDLTLTGRVVRASGAIVSPEYVAQCVIEGLADERFLILPHPEVAEYFRRKVDDHARWLNGMSRLVESLSADGS